MGNIAIDIENLTKTYMVNQSPLIVFDNFSVSFEEKRITAIIGPSGCGKSTLLRIIASLEKPTKGKVTFRKKNHKIGMIFQEKALFPWLTVEGNIGFGLELSGIPPKSQKEIKKYWLEKIGLSTFADYFPAQISGGMKQKLAMARCMAVKPNIVLMDEPFGSLDNQSKFRIISFFEDIFLSQKITVVLVTHNIEEAIYLSDKIIKFSEKPICNSINQEIYLERPRSLVTIKSKLVLDFEEKFKI